MKTVLIRYGEIGSKSGPVRGQMATALRQRIIDRLEYEEIDFDTVERKEGRIMAETESAEVAADAISEVPGVASASPAYLTGSSVSSIKKKVREKIDVGESFGVRVNRAGDPGFTSRELEEKLGSFVEEKFGASVDLENPETWIKIDLRFDQAYIFTDIFEGPDGFPVGFEGSVAALISGGIDSPVAAHEVMKRGLDITPVYFYNKPVAAEDHLIRFKSVLEKLKRFHPGKKWYYHVVDMEEVNKELLNLGRGRMLVHRKIMFKVAERIAEREGLNGIVTGESIGQKSSQTPSNLEKTSSSVRMPVHRPLLTSNKSNISEKARGIGTFEEAEVASACRSLAPENPATSIKEQKLREIEQTVDVPELVEKALESSEKLSDLKE